MPRYRSGASRCWRWPRLLDLPALPEQTSRPTSLFLGLLLVLAAEFIGRGLFYALHMTVGVAIAG
jgi:DMSO reductase anchor subunit